MMSESEICRGDQGEIRSRVLHGLICWFAGRSWANAEAFRTCRLRREESDESDSQNQDNKRHRAQHCGWCLGLATSHPDGS